ncbi:MAG: sulfite exporter TauE/SafE family protein [Deltaproteobacteria bacterium]|nr:sulfite exporter TauE/SafE family protein [Deltaproteobacteria bacterium]
MVETINSLFLDSLESSRLLAYLFAYASGLIASFTACAYSLLPVTIAIIGANSAQTRQRGLLLSLAYTLGLAVMYTALGALAVLAGVFFGSIQTNPLVNFAVGGLFVTMGLSLFGLFPLPLFTPSFVGSVRQQRNKSLLGVFLLGIVSALVSSPCSSPILIALLGYSASSGNVFFGMSLLFCFALGMGTLLILAGTSAGLLTNLPKAGAWMEKINKMAGAILIMVGGYFLVNAIILWR